ncbi:MAG: hypothetical protein L3I99_06690 [Sulfurimonas sp.]|nr:hypothetical protein [Sulfurimonas sp.]
MKINLIKVTQTQLDFDEKSDKITFKGYLQYASNKLILLKAKLSGKINTDCNICANEFELDVDEEIEFYLYNGIYKRKDEVLLDIVECFDSTVDLQEVLYSEIELIKSDYSTCKNCNE